MEVIKKRCLIISLAGILILFLLININEKKTIDIDKIEDFDFIELILEKRLIKLDY